MSIELGYELRMLSRSFGNRAEIGNTVAVDGLTTPLSLVAVGDIDLPAPVGGKTPTGDNYNGYQKLMLNPISTTSGLTIVDHEIVVGNYATGDYITPHAWLNISANTNNTVVGFVFGITKASDGLIYFSQRITGERTASKNLLTTLSGGGLVDNLEEGDKLSVWVASSKVTDLTVHDANLGIQMTMPSELKSRIS